MKKKPIKNNRRKFLKAMTGIGAGFFLSKLIPKASGYNRPTHDAKEIKGKFDDITFEPKTVNPSNEEGKIYYNDTDKKLKYRTDTEWKDIGSGEKIVPAPGTQGDILYDDGAQWLTLSPGLDGQVLETHGTGKDPSWAFSAHSSSSFQAHNVNTDTWEDIGVGYVIYSPNKISFETISGDTWAVKDEGVYKNGSIVVGDTKVIDIAHMKKCIGSGAKHCAFCEGDYKYYESQTNSGLEGNCWYYKDSSTGCHDTKRQADSNPHINTITCWRAKYDKIRVTNGATPSGVIAMWSGTLATIPASWALCDGSGGTPDLSERFIYGTTTENPGATGGESMHTLTTAEMPSHTHAYSRGSNSGVGGVCGGGGAFFYTHSSISTSSTGSGTAHENKPPYYKLAFIMKT